MGIYSTCGAERIIMFKFYDKPNREVKSLLSGKMLLRFDSKGEFITDNEDLINRLKPHFDHIELENKPIGKRIVAIDKEKVVKTTITVNKEVFNGNL